MLSKDTLSTILLIFLTTLLLFGFFFTAVKLSNLIVKAEIQLEELYNG
jgi:hypothetical protein